MRAWKLAWSIFLLGLATNSNLAAQRPSSPRQSLAVDEVRLATGKHMYGIVMQGDAVSGLTLVVERNWFESTYPKLYAEHRTAELESAKAARATQLQRLQEWKSNRAADNDLVKFIDEEIAHTIKQQNDTDPSDGPQVKPFTLISYPPNEIKEVYIQPALQHHIAGCAWKHDLKRVTTRTFAALKRELEKEQVNIENETIDLSSQLPSQQVQSDEEWNARVALFEFVLRKPLEFQGIGNTLFRIDPQKPPKLQDVLSQMLAGGAVPSIDNQSSSGLLDELLKELDLADRTGVRPRAKNRWWEPAVKIAESEGFRGVRITRVIQDISLPAATVENVFLAQLKPGEWKPVISVASAVNRNQVDAGELLRLKADPQVETVLETFGRLGIRSDELIETAIRQGAATDIARKDSEQKFLEILDRYTEHTDGPPLPAKFAD